MISGEGSQLPAIEFRYRFVPNIEPDIQLFCKLRLGRPFDPGRLKSSA